MISPTPARLQRTNREWNENQGDGQIDVDVVDVFEQPEIRH